MSSSLGFSSYAASSSTTTTTSGGSASGSNGLPSSGFGRDAGNTKKRPSCLKKNNNGTAKNSDGLVTRFLTPTSSLHDDSGAGGGDSISESFRETMDNNQSRTNRINELLAKITSPTDDPRSSPHIGGGSGGVGHDLVQSPSSSSTPSSSLLPFPIISQNEAGTSPSMGNLASLVESRHEGMTTSHPTSSSSTPALEGFSDIQSTPPFSTSSSHYAVDHPSAITQKPLSAANGVSFDQTTRYTDAYDPSQLSFLQEPGAGFAHGGGNSSPNKPYYATYYGSNKNSSGSQGFQDSVLQKLNYVTHMLEEMQLERTSNTTEELVLYSFLGIFVIFVVDSFARGGGSHGLTRYTR